MSLLSIISNDCGEKPEEVKLLFPEIRKMVENKKLVIDEKALLSNDKAYLDSLFDQINYYGDDTLLSQLFTFTRQHLKRKQPHHVFSFFKQNIDKVHWPRLCKNPSIPVSFFEENLDKIDWRGIARNEGIPSSFLEKHKDKIYLPYYCKRKDISVPFLKENIHLLDWYCWIALSFNSNVPFDFLTSHPDKIVYEEIFGHTGITHDFILDNRHRIKYPMYLVENKSIPFCNLYYYISLMDDDGEENYSYLSLSPHITEKDIRALEETINTTYLSQNHSVPLSLVMEYFDRETEEIGLSNDYTWDAICRRKDLTEEFLYDHSDILDWKILQKNNYIPLSFLEKNLHRIDTKKYCNHNLPIAFIRKYLPLFSIPVLSGCRSISLDFVRENIESIDWKRLSSNPITSIESSYYKFDKFLWDKEEK